MSVSIYMKGDYGDIHALWTTKNKAKTNPIKANFHGNEDDSERGRISP